MAYLTVNNDYSGKQTKTNNSKSHNVYNDHSLFLDVDQERDYFNYIIGGAQGGGQGDDDESPSQQGQPGKSKGARGAFQRALTVIGLAGKKPDETTPLVQQLGPPNPFPAQAHGAPLQAAPDVPPPGPLGQQVQAQAPGPAPAADAGPVVTPQQPGPQQQQPQALVPGLPDPLQVQAQGASAVSAVSASPPGSQQKPPPQQQQQQAQGAPNPQHQAPPQQQPQPVDLPVDIISLSPELLALLPIPLTMPMPKPFQDFTARRWPVPPAIETYRQAQPQDKHKVALQIFLETILSLLSIPLDQTNPFKSTQNIKAKISLDGGKLDYNYIKLLGPNLMIFIETNIERLEDLIAQHTDTFERYSVTKEFSAPPTRTIDLYGECTVPDIFTWIQNYRRALLVINVIRNIVLGSYHKVVNDTRNQRDELTQKLSDLTLVYDALQQQTDRTVVDHRAEIHDKDAQIDKQTREIEDWKAQYSAMVQQGRDEIKTRDSQIAQLQATLDSKVAELAKSQAQNTSLSISAQTEIDKLRAEIASEKEATKKATEKSVQLANLLNAPSKPKITPTYNAFTSFSPVTPVSPAIGSYGGGASAGPTFVQPLLGPGGATYAPSPLMQGATYAAPPLMTGATYAAPPLMAGPIGHASQGPLDPGTSALSQLPSAPPTHQFAQPAPAFGSYAQGGQMTYTASASADDQEDGTIDI